MDEKLNWLREKGVSDGSSNKSLLCLDLHIDVHKDQCCTNELTKKKSWMKQAKLYCHWLPIEKCLYSSFLHQSNPSEWERKRWQHLLIPCYHDEFVLLDNEMLGSGDNNDWVVVSRVALSFAESSPWSSPSSDHQILRCCMWKWVWMLFGILSWLRYFRWLSWARASEFDVIGTFVKPPLCLFVVSNLELGWGGGDR